MEGDECRATSFHVWDFLQRSGTVGNLTPQTETEQNILEIAGRTRQSQQQQHAPSSQSEPDLLALAAAGLALAATAAAKASCACRTFPALPQTAGQRR